MVTLPSAQPHQHREIAESFGDDADRYDRTRPGYPPGLVEKIAPGADVLDVGIGTGLSARRFRDAGCRVLGVEADERMAAKAREHGFEVEVARFEQWDDRGRRFDTVASGQTWHWIEPDAGAAAAGRVLRPGGKLALFWNAGDPPEAIAAGFAEVYRRVDPGLPFTPFAGPAAAGYARALTPVGDALGRTGLFTEPELWTTTWTTTVEREQWLRQVPTFGGLNRVPSDRLADLLAGMGQVIDDNGGSFVMTYTTVLIEAVAQPAA